MGMDKKIEKKKGLKTKHILWGILGLSMIAILYFTISNAHQSVYRVEKDRVTIAQVSWGEFNDYITVTGQVEPIRTILLDVEEGGKVEEIYIEEGAMVKKGDVILKLKNQDLETQIMNSESQLAYHANELRNTQINIEQQQIYNLRAKIEIDMQVTQSKRKYEQYSALFEEDLIAKEEYLRTQEDYHLALRQQELTNKKFQQDSIFRQNQKKNMDESLDNMRQNLFMARQRLDNLLVKAPEDGQLGLLNAEIGESINRGQRLGVLHILSNYKIKALIDEHYIDRVRHGLSASLERQGVSYQLVVRKVYPEVREGRFQIDMSIEGDHPENMRTGQTYYTKLQLGQSKESVLVPKGAFFQSSGGRWIYVLNQDASYAEKREIQIGRQNPQYYEVIEGLQAGEQVINSSYELFGDNDRIVFK